MILRVIVPNRGEIAARIARSCREMGIESVAAVAEDDLSAVFTQPFDQVVSLGEGSARDTYLNIGRIIDSARRAGADALHPGYGFLSERAELAQACEESGITFIGPPADAIRAMGSKAESRRLMEGHGVPVVPGYDGEEQSDERLTAEAMKVGFPLLVKASAGGGGKGMKIVRSPDMLQAAVDAARREATKSFGDDRLLLERYVERPRHVEMQIFGDRSGEIVHLFERDCSLQRRHQKVIEESPAPHYPEELRQAMASAAITAARAVGYVNAGTVEFIVTPEGEFYFLEMNTRLQVEHPVTELVTGTDLVRAQIEVASGSPLPWSQAALVQRGHAIECRIYAEDPDHDFLPQSGTIDLYREPSGVGIRVDSGVRSGSVVPVHYDPMLAKLIVHAESRSAAVARLQRALDELVILGIRTNLPYLRRVVRHEVFRRGEITTAFAQERATELGRREVSSAAPVAAILARSEREGGRRTAVTTAELPDPWILVGSDWNAL